MAKPTRRVLQDRLEPRRFDVIGAGIIAVALAALAWALSQIGRSEATAAASVSGTTVAFVGLLGAAGRLKVVVFGRRVEE